MKRRLLHYLQEVTLSPEDGEALLERLQNDILSEADRRVAVQLLRATQACQELLEQPLPAPRTSAPRHAKRKRQVAKASRRRNRC